jgi:3-dehydroquinate synthetase
MVNIKAFFMGKLLLKGMKVASKISYLENLISQKEYAEVISLLEMFEFDLSLQQYKYGELKPYIFRDKKVKKGKLNIILLNKISNAVVSNSFDTTNLQKGLKN